MIGQNKYAIVFCTKVLFFLASVKMSNTLETRNVALEPRGLCEAQSMFNKRTLNNPER